MKTKKRSILKTYIKQNEGFCISFIITVLVVLFSILSAFMGKIFLLKTGTDINPSITLYFAVGLFITSLLAALFLAFIILLIGFIDFIRKQKAVYNYFHLPLTPDEIRQAVKNGEFKDSVKGYLEYLDSKVSYHNIVTDCDKGIQFSIDDVFSIMQAVKEVFDTDRIDVMWFESLKHQPGIESEEEIIGSCNKGFLFMEDFFDGNVLKDEKRETSYYISTLSNFSKAMFYTNIILTLADERTIYADISFKDKNKKSYKGRLTIRR